MISFSIRASLISFFVLIFLLFTASTYASNKVVEVDAICKETQNPSFCSNILNSKPGGAAGADLVTLAQYTIDVVRGNVTNTINLINSLIAQSGSDPKTKEYYEQCLSDFDEKEGALANVERIQETLKSGDYYSFSNAASAIQSDAYDCIISPNDPPYINDDRSTFTDYAGFVEQVAEIILSISVYLTQS